MRNASSCGVQRDTFPEKRNGRRSTRASAHRNPPSLLSLQAKMREKTNRTIAMNQPNPDW
jgi:hypothetical protein